jgi:TetR/AcrR family transcriptional repressor of bet genes
MPRAKARPAGRAAGAREDAAGREPGTRHSVARQKTARARTASERSPGEKAAGENTAIRERRRQQLIESTIAAIARRGLSDVTLGDVAKGAKLSHGIVNFHFKSKEQLLVETLRFITEEYSSLWRRAVEKAGPGAADKLAALHLADFDPAVCTRTKLAVWHAFYGEAKSRPIYRQICGASDQERFDAGVELVRGVVDEGGYDHLDPERTARGLDALTDGLWLQLLLAASGFDREDARRTVRASLACLFPKHFSMTERDAA